jgi:hypothetical protein
VVERRHSAVFAFTAGVRFVRRRLAAAFLLYAGLFATAAAAWGVFSAVVWWAQPPVEVIRLLDAAQAASAAAAALVSCAAAVSLFQAGLAHATYVAPPPLVWPESPAIETLGAPRDIPPAV